jgi:hypothetical protein
MNLLSAAAITALLVTPANITPDIGASTVSAHEYARVQVGQTKRHVEHVFDTHGRRVVLWVGEHGHAHLWKNYRAENGQWVQVIYTRPASGGSFFLHSKATCATYHVRCGR